MKTHLIPIAILWATVAALGSDLELLLSFTDETKIKGGFAELGGQLYFTAEKGGEHGFGFVGRFNLGDKTITPIYSFTTDAKPKGGLVRVGDALYSQGEKGSVATGFGWVGQFRPETGEFRELHSYDSDVKPKSGLIAAGGALWVATEKGGVGAGSIDRLDPVSGKLATVAPLSFETGIKVESFAASADGAYVYAGAREGGDTAQVGGKGAGTLLRLETATGAVNRLIQFNASEHGTKLRGLILHAEALWFVMEEGGDLSLNSGKGGGTIAYYDLASHTVTRVHTFDGALTGLKPKGLVRAGEDFYYVTEAGGPAGLGVFGLFRRGRSAEPLAEFSAALSAKPDHYMSLHERQVLITTELGGDGYLGGIVAWTLLPRPSTPPALRISLVAGGKVRIGWFAGAGEFMLQSAAELAPESWEGVGAPREREGDETVTELPVEAQLRLYRLIETP